MDLEQGPPIDDGGKASGARIVGILPELKCSLAKGHGLTHVHVTEPGWGAEGKGGRFLTRVSPGLNFTSSAAKGLGQFKGKQIFFRPSSVM